MKVTDGLREEHEMIKLFLKILEAMSKRLTSNERVDPDDLLWMFDFSKDFIDRCHHEKEENVLFPALKRAGMPENPLTTLTLEHELARNLGKRLRGSAAGYGQGDRWAKEEIIDAAWRYIRFMDEHLETEESAFFPLADRCFTREMEEKLVEEFQEYDMDRIGPWRREELKELLDYIKIFYLQN
jgi:hemerythrin-like domain-containing protein